MEIILLTLTVTFVVFVIIYLQWIPLFFRRLKYIFYSPDYYEARLVREILERKSVFFRSLSVEGKNRMIKKSIGFMMSKRFVAMEGMALTDEMIAEISGTAAQITFGLKNSGFSHFHTIKIFPETFYSRLIDNHLKGGASAGGVLFFSWEDFQLGYSDYSDRYNLGLHEMAHALRLQLRYGSDFDSWFANYSDEWMKIARPEFLKMREGQTSFLRDYASTNMEEFFSVCVEHFFEVPNEFKANLPEIYNNLCYLLRLDPTNKNGDFKLEINFIHQMKREHAQRLARELANSKPVEITWHWSYAFILFGIFIALPFILINADSKLIQSGSLFMIPIVVLFLAFKLNDFFRWTGIVSGPHLTVFATVGIGLPLIAFILLMNNENSKFNVNRKNTSYKINGFHVRKLDDTYSEITFYLDDDALKDLQKIRQIESGNGVVEFMTKANKFILTTSNDLSGNENIEERFVVIDNDTIMLTDREN